MLKSKPLLNVIIILILLCYPALLLTVKGGMGVLFFLLLIASIACIYLTRKSDLLAHWDGYSIAFSLAMASPVVAIFLSQAYHGELSSPAYDWASRFLLSIPIFFALRQLNISTPMVLQFAIPLGALITLIALIHDPYVWEHNRHTTSEAFNRIHFGNLALILGFLALFSINREKKDHVLILIFKYGGFLAGIYMSIQTGQRGGWLAIPPLLLLWVFAHNRKNLWLKLSIVVLLLAFASWLSYSFSDLVHNRIDYIFDDLNNYAQGNKDTSIGIRIQLWHAALYLFNENPLFGVGPEGFRAAMPTLSTTGMLTPIAASLGTSEVHNEFLAKCAGTGFFGLMSILSVFFVPLFIFFRTAKSNTSIARVASYMGICLVSGFFVFGLTVEIFDLIMTSAFFSLTLAVLMAAATHRPN